MYSVEAVQALLVCPVCLDQFCEPKTLPCQHALCEDCLDGLEQEEETVQCPVCRKKHPIPDDGVEAFPDNFLINSFLSLREETEPCNDCRKGEGITVCQHCETKLCVECRVQHTEKAATIRECAKHLNAYLSSKEALTTAKEKMDHWAASVRDLKEQAVEMMDAIDEIFEELTKRKTKLQDTIDLLVEIEDRLHQVSTEDANLTVIYEHLTDRVADCKTTESLTEVRDKLAMTKSAVELLLSSNDQFHLVWDEDSLVAARNFGGIEFAGQMFNIETGEVTVADDDRSSAAVTSSATSDTSDVNYVRMELPRDVNYRKKQTGWKTILGQYYGTPENILRNPVGAVYCVQDRVVYVADHGNNRVMAYDVVENKNSRVFYTVNEPIDVAVSDRHILVLTDKAVHRVNRSGLLIGTINSFKRGPLCDCVSIVFWKDRVIVLDRGEKSVIFYDRDGKYERYFRPSTILKSPVEFAIDNRGMIYIVDLGDESSPANVKVFGWNGTFHGELAEADIDEDIMGVCVDGDGYVCVTRPNSNRVDVYSPGRLRLRVCSYGWPGQHPGCLSCPMQVRMMPDGRSIVVDNKNNRIQIF